MDNVEHYLESAKQQLHNFYLVKSMHAMKCYCHRPLIMSKSHSEKNPGRLFLKCSKQRCDFFQWVNVEPRGDTKAWMEEGRFRGVREGYPRPRKLFNPCKKKSRSRRRKFEKEKKTDRERLKNIEKETERILKH